MFKTTMDEWEKLTRATGMMLKCLLQQSSLVVISWILTSQGHLQSTVVRYAEHKHETLSVF